MDYMLFDRIVEICTYVAMIIRLALYGSIQRNLKIENGIAVENLFRFNIQLVLRDRKYRRQMCHKH